MHSYRYEVYTNAPNVEIQRGECLCESRQDAVEFLEAFYWPEFDAVVSLEELQ